MDVRNEEDRLIDPSIPFMPRVARCAEFGACGNVPLMWERGCRDTDQFRAVLLQYLPPNDVDNTLLYRANICGPRSSHAIWIAVELECCEYTIMHTHSHLPARLGDGVIYVFHMSFLSSISTKFPANYWLNGSIAHRLLYM